MEQIRVFLADDHWMMRDETRRILEQVPKIKIVGEAEDGQQAIEMIGVLKPDVVLLDIRMPRLSGIEVLPRLKDLSPGTKVLILTAYDDDDYILALMGSGASGYLLKTTSAQELIDAVERVHKGEPVLHPAIASKIARAWTGNTEMSRQKYVEPISPREQEIIQLASRGLRNKAIADMMKISVRTVEGHFNNIFNKLGVNSRVEAILFAISNQIVTLDKGDTDDDKSKN